MSANLKFTTIEQIKAHQFKGNYHDDAVAFGAIDTFVLNPSHSIADKAEALRIMGDKGLGLGREEHKSDSQIIQEYLDNA